jgi:hypothetical protein
LKQIDFTDFLAVVLIVVLAALSINLWHYYYPLYFDVYDIANHLAIARGFQRIGGITLRNFWEFPPQGQPHYYPPLLHIIGAFLLNRGYAADALAKWGTWIIYPLSLISAWLCARLIFGAKAGFYALVLLSIPLIWLEKIWGSPTNGLFLVILPLVLLALVKRRYPLLIVSTLFCLSTHLLGLVAPLAILIYAFHRGFGYRKPNHCPLACRKEYRKFLIIFCFFLIFALPFFALGIWRLFISGHASAIQKLNLAGIGDLIQIFDWRTFGYLGFLSVGGLVLGYRRKGDFLVLPSLLFSFLPLFLMQRGFRFWYPNAILFFALSGGMAVAEAHNFLLKKLGKEGIGRKLIYPVFIALFLILVFPLTNQLPGKLRWPALIVFKNPDLWEPYWLEIAHEDKIRMAEIVRENCSENEFAYMPASHNVTRAISAFSGRSVSADEQKGARIYIVRRPLSEMRRLDKIGKFYIYKELKE